MIRPGKESHEIHKVGRKKRSVRMREASQKREQRAAVNADSVSTPHIQATRQREKVKLKFNNSKYHNKSISPLIAATLNILKWFENKG